MRIILLLSSFFSLLFSFEELFYYKGNNFDVVNQRDSYKLILKHQQVFDYGKSGFSIFIPKFTKEFTLKVLRYNSTGEINGILSMNNTFTNILNVPSMSLKYYLTDYSTHSARQLDYLLKGYSIPYNKVTSISIEAYNIPKKISTKLGKYLYFKINHINKNNTLKYLIYSFYIVLDKKKVDLYIKSHHLKSINDFIKNIYNISKKIKKKPKKIIHKKIIHKKKKMPYSLHFTRFLYMKDYPFITIKDNYKIKQDCDYKLLEKDNKKLSYLSDEINRYASDSFFVNKDILKNYTDTINAISNDLLYFKCDSKIIKNKCSKIEYNKSCFKDPKYFNDYIHIAIRKDNIPDVETIISYGDYKTFNNVGKYFFERGYLKKSEVFLQKAYALKHEPLIAHNLAVLYSLHSPLYDIHKVVYYLKQSPFEIDYYNLGVFYYLGKGVEESDKKAREYFMKAKNIPMAKENLAIMNKYEIGMK